MGRVGKEEFVELIRQYKTDMYRMALMMMKNPDDAEDAVGETILKAYEKRNTIKDISKFKAWIMKILINTSKTMLVKRKRFVLAEEVRTSSHSITRPRDEMWELVNGLDKEFRDVVVLFYYMEFSVKEISEILHIAEGTVKSRLARAREKLKALL